MVYHFFQIADYGTIGGEISNFKSVCKRFELHFSNIFQNDLKHKNTISTIFEKDLKRKNMISNLVQKDLNEILFKKI